MPNKEIAQLKLQIQNEERLYYYELKTTQQYNQLKVIRRRINELKQQLALLEGEVPGSQLSFM